MNSAFFMHRLHFAFTVTYHYLFPQLTMGLAPLIFVLKWIALKNNDERYDNAARFCAKLFGINFVIGVITGIPMEFQFGTNWSHFSRFAGGVIGQTLGMEGTFAFFLESSFLGLFLYGQKILSKKAHLMSAFAVWIGSWMSGYFIVATDAWMQHPVGYQQMPNGDFVLTSFKALVLNPWALAQYVHTMGGAGVTGGFAMAALGAFYLLNRKHEDEGRIFLKTGVIAACIFSLAQLFPTGDIQGRMMAKYQPVTLAAMEAQYHNENGAGIALVGQPDDQKQAIDNPIKVPKVLSFLVHRKWNAEVKGLESFPREQWPDNVPLLYFSYHIMVGLGTIFIAVMAIATFLLWRGTLANARWMLWIVLLCFPFPFIANTAGWMTAEIGRQPWLVYGLLRTSAGFSQHVSAGNSLFTLLGFMGMYSVLSILYWFLMWREIEHGPEVVQPISAKELAALVGA